MAHHRALAVAAVQDYLQSTTPQQLPVDSRSPAAAGLQPPQSSTDEHLADGAATIAPDAPSDAVSCGVHEGSHSGALTGWGWPDTADTADAGVYRRTGQHTAMPHAESLGLSDSEQAAAAEVLASHAMHAHPSIPCVCQPFRACWGASAGFGSNHCAPDDTRAATARAPARVTPRRPRCGRAQLH